MKILKVNKDTVQVELTKEEVGELIDMWSNVDILMIIEFDMPDSQQRIYTKEEFNRVVNDIKMKK